MIVPPSQILKLYFGYKLCKPHFISEGMMSFLLGSVNYTTTHKGKEMDSGWCLFIDFYTL